MATTFNLATTDCGNIEIKCNVNIKDSSFINGYLIDMGQQEDYIDMVPLGNMGMTATQIQRFYSIWVYLSSPAGIEYLERTDIDYWQFRNFRLDDCLDDTLKALMKALPEEYNEVFTDLVQNTVVPGDQLQINEHTKAFIEKGYIGLSHISELMKYADYLCIGACIRFFAGCFASHLKSLVKVFPKPPINNSDRYDDVTAHSMS